jgi:transposase
MEQPRIIEAGDVNKAESTSNAVFNKTIIVMVMHFLQLFMCETLAKRLLSMVLISAGLQNSRVTELTGLCDRSVRQLKKDIVSENAKNLLVVEGGGRKRKLAGIEQGIIDEINAGNYHSRQQIVDMIEEKFGIRTSTSAVGRLLKKTGSDV